MTQANVNLVAFNQITKQIVVRPVEGFHAAFPAEFSVNGWVQAMCREGTEAEAINDAVWAANNPQPEMDDEYEPEYSLAGGWAAWDAR